MHPVVNFFSTLPEKHCTSCGKVLEEQADCYSNVCPECDDTHYYDLTESHAAHKAEV